MVCRSVPERGQIHIIITVCNVVSQSYDSEIVRNLFRQRCFVDFPKTFQRLTCYFQSTFHGSLGFVVTTECFKIETAEISQCGFAILQDIPDQFFCLSRIKCEYPGFGGINFLSEEGVPDSLVGNKIHLSIQELFKCGCQSCESGKPTIDLSVIEFHQKVQIALIVKPGCIQGRSEQIQVRNSKILADVGDGFCFLRREFHINRMEPALAWVKSSCWKPEWIDLADIDAQ